MIRMEPHDVVPEPAFGTTDDGYFRCAICGAWAEYAPDGKTWWHGGGTPRRADWQQRDA